MRKKSVVFMMMLMLFGVNTLEAEENTVHLLKDIASQYFTLIKQRDFINAAKLFNYPATYTKEELTEDIKSVSETLCLFSNEFGAITTKGILNLQKPILFYNVGATGGSIPYWEKYPVWLDLDYSVYFEKEGDGHINITFCNSTGKWQIRGVYYGLPVSSANSKNRIINIMQKLMQDHKEKIEDNLEKKAKKIL